MHARAAIKLWRRECNEQRPKKALCGLTLAAIAKRMADIS
jgi:putative transposase